MSDIPPSRRMYISEEEASKYTKLGIKVHRGPRGGLFVDLNDLIRAGRSEEIGEVKEGGYKEFERILDTKRLSEISIREIKFIRYDGDYIKSVRTELAKNIENGLLKENIKDISIKLKVANSMRLNSYAKTIRGDISDIVVDEEELNIDSYNGEKMKIFILKDGSRIYAKELDSNDIDDTRKMAVINNYVASYLLRLFTDNDIYRAFLPHCNIVKVNGKVYSAMEEVFGLLGGEAADSGVPLKDTEFLREFFVSGILTGLWDMHGQNFVMIPDECIIIPFDLDFTGAMGDMVPGTVGLMDLFAFFETKGKFDFKSVVDEIITRYCKFEDKIEQIIDGLVEEVKSYLLEVGYDEEEVEDVKDNFMTAWEMLGELIYCYEGGDLDIFGFLTSAASDFMGWKGVKILFELSKSLEIRKDTQVPAEFRIYVSAQQAQQLMRNGIKVYRGIRGGLYIDSREARRKGITLEQEESSSVDSMLNNIDNADKEVLDNIGNIIMKDTKAFLKVRSEFFKSADYLVEHLFDSDLGGKEQYIKHYKRAVNLAYALNKGNPGRMNNNPSITEYRKIGMDAAGARPGILNVFSMIVVELPDGSKIFMKEMDEDEEWVASSLVAPTVLKILVGDEYSSFIPTPRIATIDGEIYVGTSEIFGITEVDTGYEEPIRNMETFKKFLAAHYAIGLGDVATINYFLDPINGIFVQYDYDYVFMEGKDLSHISYAVEEFAKRFGFDANEVKRMGIQMLIDNFGKIKTNLDILKKAVKLYTMPEEIRQTFINELLRAEMFIESVVRLGGVNMDDAIQFIEREL